MKHNFTGLLRAPMRVVLYAALVLMAGLYGCSRTADTPAPPGPAFSSLSPSSQTRGGSVTIVGSNFNSTATSNTVTVNGTSATVASASATQVVFTVPLTATTGPVVLTTGGVQVNCGTLTVLAPGAASLSPTSLRPSQSGTITGSNFTPGLGFNTVTVNGIACTVTSATATQVVFTVASTATTGQVVLTTGGNQVNVGPLTVIIPSITTT